MATIGRQKTLLVAALTSTLAVGATPFATSFAFADESPQIIAQATMTTVNTGAELVTALSSDATTIQVGADIADLTSLTISKNVTLNLQGHQLTLKSADGITCSAGAVLISGGTIVNSSGSAITNTGAALTLENLTAGTSAASYAVKTSGTGSTTITGGTYTSSSSASPISGTSSNTTVTGGLFSQHIDDSLIPTSHYQLDIPDGPMRSVVFGNGGSVSGWSDATISATNAIYTGSPVTDNVSVKVGSTQLRNGSDYTLDYYNNIDAGIGVVLVRGIGSYGGKFAVATFAIEPRPVVVWVDDYHRQINQSDPTFWVQISGLVFGHTSNISSFSAHCYHTSNRGGIYEIDIVEPYEGLVIRDEFGNNVTYNYDIYERSGRLVVDVDYLDLANAEVKLASDPVPYKGAEYKDKENITSVTIDGIDVTDECTYTYTNSKNLGTATVTIRPKGSTSSSSSTSWYNGNTSSRNYDYARRSYNTLVDLVRAGEPDNVILSWFSEEGEDLALSAQASDSVIPQVMGNTRYRVSTITNAQDWTSYLIDRNSAGYIAPIRSVSGYGSYYDDGVTLSNGKVLGGSISKNFTITRCPVTVTGATLYKTIGSADPALTATVTGTIDGDESSIVYTVSRAEGEESGTYPVTPTGEIEQGNYEVTYVPGSLTISTATPETGGVLPSTPMTNVTGTETAVTAATGTIPSSTITSRLATANTADASLAGTIPAAFAGIATLAASLFARRRNR